MSHIVTIKTVCKDRAAIAAACRRLAIAAPVDGATKLYSGQAVTGTLVKLSGWIYPIVIDRATGEIRYDNYGGSWGNPKELDKFTQAYAVSKAKIEAQKNGHRVTETWLADGTIELDITVKS